MVELGEACKYFPVGDSNMNITLNIDRQIAERATKIAARKNTTLPAMVEEYLTTLADEDADRREAVARLAESIRLHSRDMGPREWTREDLYDRPKRYRE